MNYDVLKNLPITINLVGNIKSTGWTAISGSKAHHELCNSGKIKLTDTPIQPGRIYKIKYTVSNFFSGTVNSFIGDLNGSVVSANGTYEDSLLCSSTDDIGFYSDGLLDIELLSVVELKNGDGVTLAYNERLKWFTSFYSYVPDKLSSALSDFITFKNGKPYLHESESGGYDVFYGDHKASEIVFVFNENPRDVKTFLSIAINGNKVWNLTDSDDYNGIETSTGQISLLVDTDFNIENLGPVFITKKEGVYYANFFRDITSEGGLIEGDFLKGNWVKVRLVNGEENFVSLWSVFLNAV